MEAQQPSRDVRDDLRRSVAKSRKERWRSAVAAELSDRRKAILIGAVSGLLPGLGAWRLGVPWYVALPLAAALGGVAGGLFGPRIATVFWVGPLS